MDEPKFAVVDAVRRFLWWFVPPVTVAVVGVVALLIAGHVAGPFKDITIVRALVASKREFFEDEQVKRILMANGYQVHVTPIGSFEIAEKQDLDSYHFVFPSGQGAAERVRERRQGLHAISYRPFFSPVVLATYREYAVALTQATYDVDGQPKPVAVAQPGQGEPLYYNLAMDGLVKLIERKALWTDYPHLETRNRIVAQAPDPCRTYSGAVYVGLVAFARFGRPPSEDEASEFGRAIKPLFDVEGQHGEDMGPKYFAREGRTFAPVAVIYEHQFIAHQIRARERTGRVDEQRVLLYPSAQHQSAPELISLSQDGDAIGDLIMTNAELRTRAVELGFHVLSPGGTLEVDFEAFLHASGIPEPQTGIGNTETWLPAKNAFQKLITAVGGCTW